MKFVRLFIIACIVGAVGYCFFAQKKALAPTEPQQIQDEEPLVDENNMPLGDELPTRGSDFIEPVRFSGEYQEYGTGCFADGECYAIVDGKRITTIVGWAPGPVGRFEDPDIPFGTTVEVYALPTDDGRYTLYGSNDYYIRPL
ncbi:MAG: hypothetical protein MRY57_03545 [Candidatus Pacebacteria bacterium]|nr:hypothetical protein [Candidatus Paceibacterota bacterium]